MMALITEPVAACVDRLFADYVVLRHRRDRVSIPTNCSSVKLGARIAPAFLQTRLARSWRSEVPGAGYRLPGQSLTQINAREANKGERN